MATKKSNKQIGLQALIDDEDFLKAMIEKMCDKIMETEIAEFLCADPHECTDERRGYRNVYKPCILRTRVGELNLMVPKDRDGNFSTKFKSYSTARNGSSGS